MRDGVSVSLALELNKTPDAFNTNAFEQALTVGEFGGHAVAEDRYAVRYHGFAHSHIDGLTHFAHAGTLYNGVSVDVLEKGGARKLGIENAKDGILTRNVLVDIPWLRGVEWPPGRTRAGRSSRVAPVVRRWLRCITGCSAWPLWAMLTPKSTGSSDASLRFQTILKVFTSVGGEHRMSFPVVRW